MEYMVRPDDEHPGLSERDPFSPEFDRAFDESAAAQSCARAESRLAILGEMTAGVAHDFRNLLAVTESSLRLAEGSELSERARDYIAAAREGIARGTKLTNQLLSFAKKRTLDPGIDDANALLRYLEPFLKYGAGPGIRIVLELAPQMPRCLIDPSQFNAAILNLVINARDAMPDGGRIHIATDLWTTATRNPGAPAPGAYVRVRIKDCGSGISDDDARKIFDPFFTTKGEKGTGLGLPQVCAFMRMVGGYVNVASERGRGTTFDLLFPALETGDRIVLCTHG
jgi:signal transduction histidine kinase